MSSFFFICAINQGCLKGCFISKMFSTSMILATALSSHLVTESQAFSLIPQPQLSRNYKSICFPCNCHRSCCRTEHSFLLRGVRRDDDLLSNSLDRRNLLKQAMSALLTKMASLTLIETSLVFSLAVSTAEAKCTDIESCREEGERKIEADLQRNPIVSFPNGVRYRVLRPSTAASGPKVTENSSIDLAYSISTASGQYMYSKGFGFEKIESFGGRQESDLGLDSLRVVLGKQEHDVPVGIESALLGMGRGERRRVELPPGQEVGFETSNWRPEPVTRRGKVLMKQYKKKLAGFGSQPPFPAETVWDIEVLGIRNN